MKLISKLVSTRSNRSWRNHLQVVREGGLERSPHRSLLRRRRETAECGAGPPSGVLGRGAARGGAGANRDEAVEDEDDLSAHELALDVVRLGLAVGAHEAVARPDAALGEVLSVVPALCDRVLLQLLHDSLPTRAEARLLPLQAPALVGACALQHHGDGGHVLRRHAGRVPRRVVSPRVRGLRQRRGPVAGPVAGGIREARQRRHGGADHLRQLPRGLSQRLAEVREVAVRDPEDFWGAVRVPH
mmetsp:Transcript_83272/g.239360  ORF Transcript_83272/g.239360 Transcript_83272/m.239360 type:complete len:244 (-) Transcript_83272:784-1515(-)